MVGIDSSVAEIAEERKTSVLASVVADFLHLAASF